ncbi:MAG: adenylate/guanylate cyclase domain-containing protein [Micropepsaceae bacterium]
MAADVTRKLATIVALDVAGYSARTEADEARTTAEVAALRKVIEGVAARHGGRVFNTAGDGFMLEFGSSLAAVEAALELAGTCEPKVRVGVHLGDVVVQPNGDLLGHGVNVAARLMARSDPGGALVSGAVRQSIRGPVAERLQSQGMLKLDKMAETIEAFALGAMAAALSSVAPKANEPLLAVLPFENLSSDTEMQFFSDGVSEDILGRIQRGSKLKVIGRTSSFQFRGAEKAKAAAALKATHVLDGSIRRGGNKVRITAHLTEAATQTTLWSDRYDRGLEDVFAVQDEISEAIATALNAAFFLARTKKIDPAVYDMFLSTRRGWNDPLRVTANLATLETVTRLEPNYADGWGALADTRFRASTYLPYPDRSPLLAGARAALDRCTELDDANFLAGDVRYWLCDPFGNYLAQEDAIQAHLTRWPDRAESRGLFALHLETVGRNRQAAEAALAARGLDPKSEFAEFMTGLSLWRAGRFAEGRGVLEEAVQTNPDNQHAAVVLALAYAHQNDWSAVDALIAPARLARFPLREFEGFQDIIALMRDAASEKPRAFFEEMRVRVEATRHVDAQDLLWPTHFGLVNETYAMLDKAKLGPSGGRGDVMGIVAYRTQFLFAASFPELRTDPRFVKLCARLGLVEYWLATQKWPDCAEIVPYDFRAECAKYRDYPKDKFFR